MAQGPTHASGTPKEHKISKHKIPRSARVTLLVIGIIAAIYVLGAIVFSYVFMPNSTILGRNVSFKTMDQVVSSLSDRTDAYSLKVTGDNVDLTIKASEIDLSFDAHTYVESALAQTRPWLWPVEIFMTHDITNARGAEYNHDKAKELIDAALDKANENATGPVDATVAYDSGSSSFVVVAEKTGTRIMKDKAQAAIESALDSLDQTYTLGDDVLEHATVTKDEPRLAEAAESANGFLAATITLNLDGKEAGTIDASKIIDWVTLDDNLNATLDTNAVEEWGRNDLSKNLDTVGIERTYTRPDGKQVSVVGGTYGWNIDSGSLAKQIVDAVEAKKTVTIDVPTYQTAELLPDAQGRDWGNSYIDVDLSEQHVRYYDSNGALAWESDCVSGDVSKNYQTPTGVYFIDEYFNKDNPASVLRGKIDPATNKPEYESPVNHWMPFVGNSVGLHDANWRSSFGGEIYKTNGSHGCVNLPSEKATELCNLISRGTVVIVHN